MQKKKVERVRVRKMLSGLFGLLLKSMVTEHTAPHRPPWSSLSPPPAGIARSPTLSRIVLLHPGESTRSASFSGRNPVDSGRAAVLRLRVVFRCAQRDSWIRRPDLRRPQHRLLPSPCFWARPRGSSPYSSLLPLSAGLRGSACKKAPPSSPSSSPSEAVR